MSIFTARAMRGLIKANLKIYFDSRKMGLDHEDALDMVLKSRYPFEPGKKRKVMTELPGIIALNAGEERTTLRTHQEELRDLICTMYFVEMKLDFADRYTLHMRNMELVDIFNELYDSMTGTTSSALLHTGTEVSVFDFLRFPKAPSHLLSRCQDQYPSLIQK